jgi:hypothetical protein
MALFATTKVWYSQRIYVPYMSTSSKNDEPLDRSNKGVPITSRRKLDDEICIPIEGRPAPKCDSVENHIQNHLKSIALLVIKKILYLSGPAWKYFKPRLERHEPELNEKYEARRQKNWRYRKDRKLRKALDESGEPPKGYRRISKRQIKDTNDDDDSKV